MNVDREVIKKQDCEGCGKEIGMAEFILCNDGFTQRHVVFHRFCMPQLGVSDVQKNHGVLLSPAGFGFVGQDLNPPPQVPWWQQHIMKG